MPESETKFFLYGVSSRNPPTLDRTGVPVGKKTVFNEMVKFWGSIVELMIYKITGRLVSDSFFYLQLKKHIHQWILF